MKKVLFMLVSLNILPIFAMENPGTELMNAISGGRVEQVQQLVATGIDLNAKYPVEIVQAAMEGQPGTALVQMAPLMRAADLCNCGDNFLTICKVLLENGANVNTQGGVHSSVLMIAAQNGNEQLARLLFKYNVNEMTKKEVLYHCTTWGNGRMCELLLNSGMNVNKQDQEGNTILMRLAKYCQHRDCFTTIIDCGAHLNIKNNHGDTALTHAMLAGQLYPDQRWHSDLIRQKHQERITRIKTALLCFTRMKNNGDNVAGYLQRHFREWLLPSIMPATELRLDEPTDKSLNELLAAERAQVAQLPMPMAMAQPGLIERLSLRILNFW